MHGSIQGRTVWAFCAALVAALVVTPISLAQTIVFADVLNPNDPNGNSIRSVGIDGTGLHTVIPTGGGVRGLDVDPSTNKVYWTDVDNFVIRRANLNGTGQQDLVTTGLAFPSALRLNLVAGKVLWGDQVNDELPRCNLDGTGFENPIGGTPFYRGLAIDNTNGTLYWSTSDTAATGRVLKANLDGSNIQVAVPVNGSFWKPGSIALDIPHGMIYWTDAVAKFVRRANLDGSGMQNLFDGAFTGSPKGITLDLAAGKVYWGQEVNDFDTGALLFGEIRRMDLDGTNQGTVVGGLGSVNDLVLVPAPTCAADFNHIGGLNVQDIFDFLFAWFAGAPSADFNHTGGITVADIFDFLAAWFAGC